METSERKVFPVTEKDNVELTKRDNQALDPVVAPISNQLPDLKVVMDPNISTKSNITVPSSINPIMNDAVADEEETSPAPQAPIWSVILLFIFGSYVLPILGLSYFVLSPHYADKEGTQIMFFSHLAIVAVALLLHNNTMLSIFSHVMRVRTVGCLSLVSFVVFVIIYANTVNMKALQKPTPPTPIDLSYPANIFPPDTESLRSSQNGQLNNYYYALNQTLAQESALALQTPREAKQRLIDSLGEALVGILGLPAVFANIYPDEFVVPFNNDLCTATTGRFMFESALPAVTGDCSRTIKPCLSFCQACIKACDGITHLIDVIGPNGVYRSTLIGTINPATAPYIDMLDNLLVLYHSNCSADSPLIEASNTYCMDGIQQFEPREPGNCNTTYRNLQLLKYNDELANYQTSLNDYAQGVVSWQSTVTILPFIAVTFHMVICLLALFAIGRLYGIKVLDFSDSSMSLKQWFDTVPRFIPVPVGLSLAIVIVTHLMAVEAELNSYVFVPSKLSQSTTIAPIACVLLHFVSVFIFQTSINILKCNDENIIVNAGLPSPQKRRSTYSNQTKDTPTMKIKAKKCIKRAIRCVNDIMDKVVAIKKDFSLFGTRYYMSAVGGGVTETTIQLALFVTLAASIHSEAFLLQCFAISSVISISPFVAIRSRTAYNFVHVAFSVFSLFFNFSNTYGVINFTENKTYLLVFSFASSAVRSSRSILAVVQYYLLRRLGKEFERRKKRILLAGKTKPDILERQERAIDHVQKLASTPLIHRSRFTVRVSITLLFFGFMFFIINCYRVIHQNAVCVGEVGSLWDFVNPKLFFTQGYFHETTCDYSQTFSIDLSNRGLTAIPISNIMFFTALNSLDVSNNKISVIPGDLARLPLVYLKASNNDIVSIDPLVLEIPNYKNLDLTGNPCATELNLSGQQLTYVPRHLSFISSTLKYLDLHKNLIENISPFSNFTFANLTTLDLSQNLISEIDDNSFSTLLATQYLNISNNLLISTRSLSATDSGPHTLLYNQWIDISNNRLQQVPFVFAVAMIYSRFYDTPYINCITKLHIWGNPIYEINFSKTLYIHSLDYPYLGDIAHHIVNASFVGLPDAKSYPTLLTGSPSLEMLNLTDAAWGDWWPGTLAYDYFMWWNFVGSFPNLVTLDISNYVMNCLLPPAHYSLVQKLGSTLKNLGIRYLSYQEVFPEIGDFPLLLDLDVSFFFDNNNGIPFRINSNSVLESLHFDWSLLNHTHPSTIEFFSSLPSSLKYLSLHSTGIETIPINLPINLQELYLSRNLLANITADTMLTTLTNLTLLDLSGNVFTLFNSSFLTSLPKLQCLRLGPAATSFGSFDVFHDDSNGYVNLLNVEVADLRSVRNISGLNFNPSVIKRICVDITQLGSCITSYSSSVCSLSNCEEYLSCHPPKFPEPPFALLNLALMPTTFYMCGVYQLETPIVPTSTNCSAWRATYGCTGSLDELRPRWIDADLPCSEIVPPYYTGHFIDTALSGYCECINRPNVYFSCNRPNVNCEVECEQQIELS